MPSTSLPLVAIEDKAKRTILDVIRQEPDGEDLGLVVSISGIDGTAFKYSLAMVRLEDVAPSDHLVPAGELTIVVPDGDRESLRGATIKMSKNLRCTR